MGNCAGAPVPTPCPVAVVPCCASLYLFRHTTTDHSAHSPILVDFVFVPLALRGGWNAFGAITEPLTCVGLSGDC
eukprot:4600959-Prymnesium_polylepis.1